MKPLRIAPFLGKLSPSGAPRLCRASLLLILAPLAGGCFQNPPPSATPFGEEPADRSIRIFVTNLNFMDATLWALTPGTREKLGVVTGKREAIYTLPWRNYTDLKIEIDILAGPRCTTEALPVDPGDDIELIIDQDMINSPLCKRLPAP